MTKCRYGRIKKKCEMCGTLFLTAYHRPHQIFCGSGKLRTGCSYKNGLLLSIEWARNHPKRIREIQSSWYWRKGKLKRQLNSL